MFRSRVRLFVLVALLGVSFAGSFLACSHAPSQTGSAVPAKRETDQAEAEMVGPPQVAWKDMNYEQRSAYMSKVVLPTMAPLFKKFDAKRYADFNCSTCHGNDAAARRFTMPNPDMIAIPAPGDQEAFAPIYAQMPDMVAFMGEKVMPTMVSLLGAEPFDYTNPKPDAFGCLGCHTQKP